MLLGPMGLVVVQMAPQLYGLVRKPLATLHRAAGEPLRHAFSKLSNEEVIARSIQKLAHAPTRLT